MHRPQLTATSAREWVHLLILDELRTIRGEAPVVVKGGVNLRLFFGSVRYSEDMDLDAAPEARGAVRSCLRRVIEDQSLTPKLRTLGLRTLDPGQGVNKDTETTFRYKFGVIGPGQVRYLTKIEVSFRGLHPADEVLRELPSPLITGRYGLDPTPIRHYARTAAIRQKIEALSGRREVQARDVFDLRVLVGDVVEERLTSSLAALLRREVLERARDRAFDLSFHEFEGQVAEFLDEGARAEMGTTQAWDLARLTTASLINQILGRQDEP